MTENEHKLVKNKKACCFADCSLGTDLGVGAADSELEIDLVRAHLSFSCACLCVFICVDVCVLVCRGQYQVSFSATLYF